MRASPTVSRSAYRLSAPSRERGEHARMMEHAAVRRRRGAGGNDAAYWRACAPAALARAAAMRQSVGFAALP